MKAKRFLSLPLVAMGLTAFAANEPVVLTIDGEPIYKSEFEYVYNKNNATTTAEKKSVEEYVDLFVNYKLKVLNAKEQDFDRQRGYLAEYKQYRDQLALPYFMSKSDVTVLIREAYERLKKQVACSHILVKTDGKDTIAAYNKIRKIKAELDKGGNFSELAREYSDCPSGKEGGYLGNVTCFQMVYPFENVVYGLKQGQTSDIFKTKFGYHIATVLDVRPNVTKKKPSQIFISSGDPRAEQKIDSLFKLVEKGANFKELATKTNVGSFGGDGQMNWITTGSSNVPPEVENAVSNLEKVGEMGKVHSRIGWHIFRLDSTNLDIPFEQMEEPIRQQILHSDRMERAHELLLEGLMERYNVTVNEDAFGDFVPLCRDKEDQDLEGAYEKLNKPLFTFLDETVPQGDFVNFFDRERKEWNIVVNTHKLTEAKRKQFPYKTDEEFVKGTFQKFLKNVVLEMSYKQLESSEPEYRNLLNEYSDGLLLFNISSDKVWNVASKDADGLKKFFEANPGKFDWDEPHFRGKIIYCTDSKVKKNVIKFCEKNKNLSDEELSKALKNEFRKDNKNLISVKSGSFAKGASKAVDFYIFKQGDAYEVERESMPEVYVTGELTKKPLDYKEVRGAVVSEYQNKLDADWVKKLRSEHKVVVNYDVLKTIK